MECDKCNKPIIGTSDQSFAGNLLRLYNEALRDPEQALGFTGTETPPYPLCRSCASQSAVAQRLLGNVLARDLLKRKEEEAKAEK